jgi:hypothetical protein
MVRCLRSPPPPRARACAQPMHARTSDLQAAAGGTAAVTAAGGGCLNGRSLRAGGRAGGASPPPVSDGPRPRSRAASPCCIVVRCVVLRLSRSCCIAASCLHAATNNVASLRPAPRARRIAARSYAPGLDLVAAFFGCQLAGAVAVRSVRCRTCRPVGTAPCRVSTRVVLCHSLLFRVLDSAVPTAAARARSRVRGRPGRRRSLL